jgi:NAD(P)-dependent dehydrogenase (short-subunit alcohol dehydrogenase family)
VTQADSVAAAADEVRTAVGADGVHGLVNNAGIVVVGPLEALAIDDIRRQLEVNVVGQIAVTQASTLSIWTSGMPVTARVLSSTPSTGVPPAALASAVSSSAKPSACGSVTLPVEVTATRFSSSIESSPRRMRCCSASVFMLPASEPVPLVPRHRAIPTAFPPLGLDSPN